MNRVVVMINSLIARIVLSQSMEIVGNKKWKCTLNKEANAILFLKKPTQHITYRFSLHILCIVIYPCQHSFKRTGGEVVLSQIIENLSRKLFLFHVRILHSEVLQKLEKNGFGLWREGSSPLFS